MKVIVWKIPNWTASKFPEGYYNVRIGFKEVDNEKVSVHLNLITKEKDIVSRWLPAIAEGNVLEVQLQGNKKNINRYGHFTLSHKTTGKRLTAPGVDNVRQ